jgi:saccharopine dehydrogenase-like NADP-dependent oxidoreductase
MLLRVLVLDGASDMGSSIVEAHCNFKVNEILVGDISYARAENVSETFNKMFDCNTYPVKVDALSIESLRGATSDLDVVVNVVGPFYKYGYRIG